MRLAPFAVALVLGGFVAPATAQRGPLPITVVVEPLRWEGTAEVYPPGGTLKIGVRTSIDQIGNVVSESWPLDVGEAKGLRRMRINDGGGTIERDGNSRPMSEEMATEEQEQFDFYRYLQLAAEKAPEMAALGVNVFEVWGASSTWFRIDREGNLIGAVNEVNAVGGTAYQEFRFEGFWHSSESVFPKHMEMLRDGQRFFTLDVSKFEAGAAH